jgi:hypothetical protein
MKPNLSPIDTTLLHFKCLMKCLKSAPLRKRSLKKIPFYLRGAARGIGCLIKPQEVIPEILTQPTAITQTSSGYQPHQEGNPWTSIVRKQRELGFHPDGSPIEPIGQGSGFFPVKLLERIGAG